MTKFPGLIFTKAIGIPGGEGHSGGLSSEKSKLGSIQRRMPSVKQNAVETKTSSKIVSRRFDEAARILRIAAANACRRERSKRSRESLKTEYDRKAAVSAINRSQPQQPKVEGLASHRSPVQLVG